MKFIRLLLAATITASSSQALAQNVTDEPLMLDQSLKKQALTGEQARKLIERAEDGDRQAISDLQSDMDEFNNPWSMNALAYVSSRGVLGKKDAKRAFQLLSKAASLGNSLAIANLGDLYERGDGVEKDLAKATDLYQQSASMEDAVGQAKLGMLYFHGVGVEKDIEKGIGLIKKSADQKSGVGVTLLALIYWGQLDGREHKASELAALLRIGADKGVIVAQEVLADFYLQGTGVAQNNNEAFRLFFAASKKGSAKGMLGAAKMMEEGKAGQLFELDEIVKLYRRAANLDNEEAKAALVRLTSQIEVEERKRVEKERALEAKRLAEEAAKPRNPSEVSGADVQKTAKRTVRTNEKGNAEFEYSDARANYGFEHLQHRGVIAFHVDNRSDRTIGLEPRMIVVTTERGATSPCSFSHVSMFGMTPAGIGTSIKPKSDSLFILAGCDTQQPYLVKDRIKSITIDGLVVKR